MSFYIWPLLLVFLYFPAGGVDLKGCQLVIVNDLIQVLHLKSILYAWFMNKKDTYIEMSKF